MPRANRKQVEIRFYEELNDLLPKHRQKRDFYHEFTGSPTVKDLIERLGVPHTEVDLILVNGISVDFTRRIRDGDRISVYPVFEAMEIAPATRLRPKPLRRVAFILDVHLGKLARLMRMLGFDALYKTDYSDETIIRIAVAEKRIILTRDRGILKNRAVTHGCYIRSVTPLEQAREVVRRLDLHSRLQPFTRCLNCNGSIVPVDKQSVLHRLQPRTTRFFDEFYRCGNCGKIYWKGSHFDHMSRLVSLISA